LDQTGSEVATMLPPAWATQARELEAHLGRQSNHNYDAAA